MLHRWTHERFAEGPSSTISEVLDWDRSRIMLALEDQYQAVKVPGQTRIPEGLYELDVRPDSPAFAHYYDRFDWYRGMPWFRDIEGDEEGFEAMGFTWVYYHPGSTHEDSRGCPLTADEYEETLRGDYRVKPGTSVPAFRRLCTELVYPIVLDGSSTDRILVRVTDRRLERP